MTDTEQTEPERPMSAKWRLLEVGEELCGGDEFWWDRWRPVATDDVPDGVEVGMPLSDRAGPHRRRMTPAEEHAEELLDMVSVARVIIQKLWDDAEPMREWDPKIHAWLESAANLPTYLP